MDYEKKYKEALERAKEKYTKCYSPTLLDYIFPELKENKDIEIRRSIISNLKRYVNCIKDGYDASSAKDFVIKEIKKQIAWLEKQGDKPKGKSTLEAVKEEKIDNQTCVKPADKFEPKFKLGDWITDGCLHCKIIQVLDECYIVDSKFGKTSIFFKREYNYHLWSIQDARDGDILAGSKDEVILMFRGIGNTEWNDVIDYHCYYDCYRKEFIKQKCLNFWGYVDNNNLKPATKKQRALLFSKIKESGWEWDSKKKELRKGE